MPKETLLEQRRLSLPFMQYIWLASREQQPSFHTGDAAAGRKLHTKGVREPCMDAGLAAEMCLSLWQRSAASDWTSCRR